MGILFSTSSINFGSREPKPELFSLTFPDNMNTNDVMLPNLGIIAGDDLQISIQVSRESSSSALLEIPKTLNVRMHV